MKIILQILLPFIIAGGCYLGIKKIISLKEDPQRKKPKIAIPIVQTKKFLRQDHAPTVSTFGVVEPFDTANISSQVSGKIIKLNPHFRVGNQLEKNSIIAEIDQADFKAILAETEAAVSMAERALAEEKVNAKQAIDDWVESGRDIKSASDFYLRKPQLQAAESTLTSAKERVAKAQIDLERTIIKSPFTGIVTLENVSNGRYLTPQISLGEIMAMNKVEVILSLTPRQIKNINTEKTPLNIILADPQRPSLSWKAQITRTSPVIDRDNQVHQCIAEIENPYADDKPLPVGTYVTAEIPGKRLTNTFAIPESALINDSFIWIFEDDKILKLPVQKIKSQSGTVYISVDENVSDKLTVVTHPLTSFRNEMAVRIKGDNPKDAKKRSPKKVIE